MSSTLPDGATAVQAAGMGARYELLRELVRHSGQARLRVSGTSMVPTIWPGDELVLQSVSGQIFAGDIVAFVRGGQLIIHRVIALGAATVTTQGDRLAAADPPLAREELIGKVGTITHKGRQAAFSRRRSLCACLLRWLSRVSDKPVVVLLRCMNRTSASTFSAGRG